MGKLKDAIDAYNALKKERLPPEILAIMNQSTEELKALGIEHRALRTGDTMPDFTLPNQHGELRSLSGYLMVTHHFEYLSRKLVSVLQSRDESLARCAA